MHRLDQLIASLISKSVVMNSLSTTSSHAIVLYLGLLLATEAPVMTLNGVDFSFFDSFNDPVMGMPSTEL